MLSDPKMILFSKKLKKGQEEEHKLLSSGESISTVTSSQGTVNSATPKIVPKHNTKTWIDMEKETIQYIDKDKNITIYKPTTHAINADDDSDTETKPLKFKNIWKQLLASLGVSFSSMAGGYISAYSSPALASMRQEGSTLIPNEEEGSWIGSLMPLSALFGGLIGGIIIERLGRKGAILLAGVPFIVSWLLIGLAANIWMVFAGRAIAGFCVGLTSLCHPVYLGETIQPEVRGTLGLLPSTFGNFGVLLAFFLGYFLEWRALAFVGAVLPLPFMVLMCLVPETPRMLLMKGDEKGARKALKWFRGRDTDVEPELDAIKNSTGQSPSTTNTSFDSSTKASSDNTITKSPTGSEKSIASSIGSVWWKSELFAWEYVRPLSISLGLMFFQQFSGINAVIFYTVSIFRDAGSTINENICTIIVGVVNFGSTFLATILIDRMGRKILLYLSSATMVVSLVTLSVFFWAQSAYGNESVNLNYGWLPLVAFIVFVVGFSLGFGPVPWLMMGEILPGKIRGQAASIVTAFNWTGTFVVTKTFHDFLKILGAYGTFAVFAGVCLIAIVFVAWAVPETQGQSLEDIEKQFTNAGKARTRANSLANFKPSANSIP